MGRIIRARRLGQCPDTVRTDVAAKEEVGCVQMVCSARPTAAVGVMEVESTYVTGGQGRVGPLAVDAWGSTGCRRI